jgi:sterol-4alpha-carboxylate 3-dehydrogenase (decarboxylating)
MAAFESYLVIGGSGFLGRHIVEALVARGEKEVAVLDIVQRYDDVRFFSADITNEADVADVIRKVSSHMRPNTSATAYPVVPGKRYMHHSHCVSSARPWQRNILESQC